MTDLLPDGTVLQNSTKLKSMPVFNLNAPQKAIVNEVFYIDDERNPAGDTVRAKVEVMTEHGNFLIPPVRIAYKRFGVENCEEWNPRPSKSHIDGKLYVKETISDPITGKIIAKKTQSDYLDGDIVIVTFINGNIYDGYITGFITRGTDISSKITAKKEDGDRYLFQHQGMRIKIDKDGNYLMESFQSQLPEMKTNNNQKRTIKIKNYDKDGKGQEIELDNNSNTLKIKRTGEFETFLSFDNTTATIKLKESKIELKEKEALIEIEGGDQLQIKPDEFLAKTKSGDQLSMKSGVVDLKNVAGSQVTLDQADAIVKGVANSILGGNAQTQIKGALILLGESGLPIARVGDQVISIGNLGIPAVGNIVSGSAKVTSV